jgi:hypothetical protein
MNRKNKLDIKANGYDLNFEAVFNLTFDNYKKLRTQLMILFFNSNWFICCWSHILFWN